MCTLCVVCECVRDTYAHICMHVACVCICVRAYTGARVYLYLWYMCVHVCAYICACVHSHRCPTKVSFNDGITYPESVTQISRNFWFWFWCFYGFNVTSSFLILSRNGSSSCVVCTKERRILMVKVQAINSCCRCPNQERIVICHKHNVHGAYRTPLALTELSSVVAKS
jgi:hypothetical protein